MFQMPEESSDASDDAELDIEAAGYTATFNQLAHGSVRDSKPAALPDPQLYLAKSLQKLASRSPGNVKQGIHGVDPSVKPVLDICLKLANVTLN